MFGFGLNPQANALGMFGQNCFALVTSMLYLKPDLCMSHGVFKFKPSFK